MTNEQKRLLRKIADIHTSHERRRWIGERLAAIGDDRSGTGLDERGLPQIEWLPALEGGDVDIEGRFFTVKPFYIAKYVITQQQFRAFLQADDGFADERWWQGFPDHAIKWRSRIEKVQYDTFPCHSVSWYQSLAFTRWLDAKYREHGLFAPFPPADWKIRLPTEQEWQWTAQNGADNRPYPWGEWDDYPRANTMETIDSPTTSPIRTAVGMYPHGAAACGAMDMTGNVWEWCLNNYTEIVGGYGSGLKVLRGGSFDNDRYFALTTYRHADNPFYGHNNYGLRVVLATRRVEDV